MSPQHLKKLEDLFIIELKDLYDAEQQLMEAIPKMEKAAQSEDLKRSFKQHLDTTKEQAKRIETIFSDMEGSPRGKKCVGMQGLIKEAEDLIKDENISKDVLDAGLLASAQKAEHYEIAGYGTARTYARELGYENAVQLLQTTLDEESGFNEHLTSLAEGKLNYEAMK
jgi:ferritin-like metal-binding protein YciE